METKNILDEIKQIKDDLPRQQRLLCEYILSSPILASSQTISEMAKSAGVGTTTVIRMAEAMGFCKYNQFKSRLREDVLEYRTTSYMVYWDTLRGSISPKNNLLSAIDACTEAMLSLKRPDFIRQVSIGANLILDAGRVYVLGLRMSVGTSLLMESTLKNYSIDTCLLSREADYVIDHICEMRENDLLLCFASSPAAKTTMDAVRLCRRLDRKSLIITGGLKADVSDLATMVINTGISRRPAVIPSLILTMELLTMEIARLLDERGESARKNHIKKVEEISVENHLSIWE